mmetsp:Transcript_11324/g.32133  ORF Transcript_11324/g.32133 Transcript_11324/m.32133 type:complete len:397 (-) Transcript_11324:540-1730(-)
MSNPPGTPPLGGAVKPKIGGRTPGRKRGTDPVCKVQGCGRPVKHLKTLNIRYRICDEHVKAEHVVVDGEKRRFCQQCSRLQLVSEFDGNKRSCRERLERIGKRRKQRLKDDNAQTPREVGTCGVSSSEVTPDLQRMAPKPGLETESQHALHEAHVGLSSTEASPHGYQSSPCSELNAASVSKSANSQGLGQKIRTQVQDRTQPVDAGLQRAAVLSALQDALKVSQVSNAMSVSDRMGAAPLQPDSPSSPAGVPLGSGVFSIGRPKSSDKLRRASSSGLLPAPDSVPSGSFSLPSLGQTSSFNPSFSLPEAIPCSTRMSASHQGLAVSTVLDSLQMEASEMHAPVSSSQTASINPLLMQHSVRPLVSYPCSYALPCRGCLIKWCVFKLVYVMYLSRV